MPTFTKLAQPQASELAKEAIEKEPVHKRESQSGPDPILEGSKGPQVSAKEVSDIAAGTRWILTENLDIAH